MSIVISEKEFLEKYPSVYENSVKEFIEFCHVHNNTLPQSTIDLAARVLFNKDLSSRQVPVITLRMGLGKTTLVNLYTKYMRTVNKDYGALISVERIKTIEELVPKYENCYGLYGFQEYDCLKKFTFYNPNMCRICDETTCRVSMNERFVPVSPLLMITHSRLNLIMQDKTALNEIMYFYDNLDRNTQYRRFDLFVDECPGFFTIDKLNEKNFEIFQSSLHNVYRKDCKQRRDVLNYFSKFIIAIREELKTDAKGFYKIDSITNSDESFSEFLFYKKKFMMNYYGAYYQLCLNAINAIHQGGYIQNHTITAPREHELKTGDHRTIILDGTAHINASYPQNCLIIDFPDKLTFPNITWTIDPDHNTSKEYLHTHPEFIPKMKDFIVKQLEKHNKILLVTFKDFESQYRSYFTPEELERIYIDHFNNMKGKNEYRDATCMFYLGTLYKGDLYYLYYYKYCKKLEEVNIDIETLDFINKNSQRIPIYKDTKEICTELVKLINCDQADLIVQDGFRPEPRTNELSFTDYFIFCTNDELKEKIHEFFPGCTIKSESILQKEPTDFIKFTNYIKEFIKSESKKLLKKDIRTNLNISVSALTKSFNNDEITKLLKDNNINLNKFYIEKAI